ncbi:MAG TPA: hypothetical protein VFI21_10885 [Nocardioides sp.]|nr:hypothetical protein [Nocardioides sp.]
MSELWPVAMVGHCLGINRASGNGATVVWPHGTEITAGDPLTIEVPDLRMPVSDPPFAAPNWWIPHR